MSVLAGSTAHEPVVGAFGLSGCHNIATRFRLQVFGIVPIHSHILDELEGIHMLLIIFYHVCSHLQRAVHCDIKCQLTGQGRVHMVGIVGIVLAHVHLEDARSVVHRTSLKSSEWKYGGMERFATIGGLILRTSCCLVAYHVRPGTA